MASRQFDDSDLIALRRWLELNQESASEKLVDELVAVISGDYPSDRIVATNSAMGALHMSLQLLGVGPGDEVIVDPVVVFAGMAAMYQNAVPRFADVDPLTFNMSPHSVARLVNHRTKAIICTHLFGNPCDVEELRSAAPGVPIIEDCAHALHSTRAGLRVGLFGELSAFSFNHRKQLSTGQGGFLVINDAALAEKSLDQGFGRVPSRLSWNYAMSGIVAALAMAQWEHARAYVQEDHRLARLLNEAVATCDWLRPQQISEDCWSSYHIWSAVFSGDDEGIEYPEFIDRLATNGGDYFLPAFMPYGAFGLDPSPVYKYPIFSEPRAYPLSCPVRCPHYDGEGIIGPDGCPEAEYLVPRLLNTVLSPIPSDRVERYAEALHKTVQSYL